MKRCLLLTLLLLLLLPAWARHGKGGSLTYKYIGQGAGANTSQYEVTVLHYVNCQESEFETGQIYLGVFDAGTNNLVTSFSIDRSANNTIQRQTFDACINPAPTICFFLASYTKVIELTNNSAGYILSEQECCRAEAIVNVQEPGTKGTTNMANIPGIINGVVYRKNNSPVLAIKDTAVICFNSYFEIDFSGVDTDGDALTYEFCNSDEGGSRDDRQPNPPTKPPYDPVTYSQGYSGLAPIGNKVTINNKTGLISGIAPAGTGQYSITVCIHETRNGIVISTTKKEVLITVADCTLTAAKLQPVYINCDSLTMKFENESISSNVSSYLWTFDVNGAPANTSNEPTPTFTYTKAGTYTLKLKVGSQTGCSDSTTATVKVYPGFTPAFNNTGSCWQSPFTFTDATVAAYGVVDSWNWSFGDANSTADVSSLRSAIYQYTSPQSATATLQVSSSVGCTGSISKVVLVNDKPQIILPFTDTLICNGDRLPLGVQALGDIQWKPAYNIENATTKTPVVYPADTTTYTVTVTDKVCIDSAKIKVNVLDFITVKLPADTGICLTDQFVFSPISDALGYAWSESGNNNTLSNKNIKNPIAAPRNETTYFVTANLGHCIDKAQTMVHLSPYPKAVVSGDTTICYGTTAILRGITTAANYNWTPAASMLYANTLSPVAGPMSTTSYILTISDTLFCPKPVQDTVVVTVRPQLHVSAGNDTTIVVNQPLQLLASADQEIYSYTWSPALALNNAFVANPLATFSSPDSVVYMVTAYTADGCKGTDNVTVFIYKTLPGMFIPNAFTPNKDGQNDVFRPILAGIAEFNFFRIYNRMGQLLFETSQAGKGWDGTINGKPQPPGTYVYTAAGKNYLNKPVFYKGTVVLVR